MQCTQLFMVCVEYYYDVVRIIHFLELPISYRHDFVKGVNWNWSRLFELVVERVSNEWGRPASQPANRRGVALLTFLNDWLRFINSFTAVSRWQSFASIIQINVWNNLVSTRTNLAYHKSGNYSTGVLLFDLRIVSSRIPSNAEGLTEFPV